MPGFVQSGRAAVALSPYNSRHGRRPAKWHVPGRFPSGVKEACRDVCGDSLRSGRAVDRPPESGRRTDSDSSRARLPRSAAAMLATHAWSRLPATASPEEVAARIESRGGPGIERIRRRLRGDPDTIVATALQKDPSRYASAEQLAADIDRHLTGRPVAARPDPLHAPAIPATAPSVRPQRTRVKEEESAEVGSALALLAGLSADLGDCAGSRDRALQALVIQEHVLTPENPELASRRGEVARSHFSLGELDEARAALERALEIKERELGPDHRDLGSPLNNLAILHWQQGELEAAKPLFERALALWERDLGPEHRSVAHVL
ncbi:MAG: tetratricopeptide repeat protein, partial [Gemmatimonas sp.]|nr:tetratricopeptide repeat protein [Gemmatimonas sp.]